MTVETQDISITKISSEPGSAAFQVEVGLERVGRAEASATNSYAKRARLPGFRKGKAPLNVIKRQFAGAIREAVLHELINDTWKTLKEQEALKPIADPRVRELKYDAGEPVRFQLEVDVKPEISLSRIGGFELTRAARAVSDEMVDEQIEDLRRRRAPWVPVEATPVPGNLVSVSITTLGEESDEPSQYQIVIGEGQAIPALEEEIMKLKPGETAEPTITYPADFPDESKRNQARAVRVSLQEVKRLDLPPLDDVFAREAGDFESLATLRAAVRSDLEAEARRESEADVRRQLIDRIVEANSLEAPKPLVRRLLSGYAQAYEVPDTQLETFSAEFAPIAERQVMRDLILDHVAQQENLHASEADIDKKIAELAERRKAKPGEVYAALQKAGRLKEIEHGLTEEKVFAHLLAQSTVTEGT